jgi:hypothetical protein
MKKLAITTGLVKKKFQIPETDVILTYIELPYLERKTLLYSHLVEGKLSVEKSVDLAFAFMEKMIVGWENVTDEGGDDIEFDKSLIRKVNEDIYLPFLDEIVAQATQEFFDSDAGVENPEPEDESKNS